MASVLLKLTLTPVLVALASLAGRRWGPAIGGWLVALPLTSGPVVWFLAREQGADFAAVAAHGILTGTLSQSAYCLGYLWLGRGHTWQRALGGACAGFLLATVLLRQVDVPAPLASVLVFASLAGTLLILPSGEPAKHHAASPIPCWELPARMAAATGLVLFITAAAPLLGAYLAGLITPFPVYGSVLSAFAHRQSGWRAGIHVLRGLLSGLFGFTAFFLALTALLSRTGELIAFAVAIALDLACQVMALLLLRRSLPFSRPREFDSRPSVRVE